MPKSRKYKAHWLNEIVDNLHSPHVIVYPAGKGWKWKIFLKNCDGFWERQETSVGYFAHHHEAMHDAEMTALQYSD